MKDIIEGESNQLARFYMYALVVILVIAAALVFLLYFFIPETTPNYASYLEIDPNSMSVDQRATDVAAWTQDVANNVKPSENRNKFAMIVESFTDDDLVSADEYRMINDAYSQLKSEVHFEVINESIAIINDAPLSAVKTDESNANKSKL